MWCYFFLQIKKKDNFCKQNSLPPIRQKEKKPDKKHKIYSHKKYKRYKNNFVKSNNFHAKKENVSEKYKQLSKFKNKFNMLKMDSKNKKELFQILDDFSLNLLNMLKIIPCKNIKFVKTLTKSEENGKSTLIFKEPFKRLIKRKSNDLTINDLQHEINIIKREISGLKHKNNPELMMLKDAQTDKTYDEHKDGDEPSQQTLLSGKGITNVFFDSQLALINKILLPKWFTKVKIVVSPDYNFTVIAMIDSGSDINCIQEGLIPSKYFEKSTERLVSANGSQMKIKYELNNAHVCHDNVCFKIPSVLVRNMTDKVILGLPFINALYPFLVEHDGITTDPFGQKVKFKFASKTEIDDALNLIHAKIRHLNFLQQEVRYKKIAKQISNKLLQSKIDNFQKMLIDNVCSDVPNAFWHRKKHIVDLPYVKDFNEKNIPTKARPIQMNAETVEFCKKEISDLLEKKLIRNSKSPWSCSAFYVQKNAEIE